jgi:hypothetical protein
MEEYDSALYVEGTVIKNHSDVSWNQKYVTSYCESTIGKAKDHIVGS